MKPKLSILDRAFAYKPSYATAIADTWRRFGWRPVKRKPEEPQTQLAHSASCRAHGKANAQPAKVDRDENG